MILCWKFREHILCHLPIFPIAPHFRPFRPCGPYFSFNLTIFSFNATQHSTISTVSTHRSHLDTTAGTPDSSGSGPCGSSRRRINPAFRLTSLSLCVMVSTCAPATQDDYDYSYFRLPAVSIAG